MAHHVQKKATRGHNAFRPRKHRPSDINRKPTDYPEIPTRAWMTPISSLSGKPSSTVTIEITPEDSPETLVAKVTAAGGTAPDTFMYGGKPLTGKLGDAGLTETTSIEAELA